MNLGARQTINDNIIYVDNVEKLNRFHTPPSAVHFSQESAAASYRQVNDTSTLVQHVDYPDEIYSRGDFTTQSTLAFRVKPPTADEEPSSDSSVRMSHVFAHTTVGD